MKGRPAGYSGKPLAAKLGIRSGSRLLVSGGPEGYQELLEPLPEGVEIVQAEERGQGEDFIQTEDFPPGEFAEIDLVHVFATSRAELGPALARYREVLRSDAVVWASWPKKASKVPTDLTEDRIRELALPLGFVDVKVCAVTEVWSGLKLVVRKELR